jgi:hypothetical protein
MVLSEEDLPEALRGFDLARDDVLDNETMAEQGLPGSTTGEIAATGRISGYLREFASPGDVTEFEAGSNLMAATVVHMFQDRSEVSRWMTDKFIGEFQRSVGKDLGTGQQLLSAEKLDFSGFAEETVGLRTLQTTPFGLVSSTIVDFSLGKLLGVAYVVALGDVERKELAHRMGVELERRMIKVMLGAI